ESEGSGEGDGQVSDCVVGEVDTVEVPGAQLRDLADGAGDGVLVALRAGLRVVDRTQALVPAVLLFEARLVGGELGRTREPVAHEVHAGVERGGGFYGSLGERFGQDRSRQE